MSSISFMSFPHPLACWSALLCIIDKVLDGPYCVFVWITKGSQLLADKLDSIPLQTEAVEPGHVAGTWHADWSSAPGASLHCTWMHAVTLIGSNTFLFASSQSVTEGLATGQARLHSLSRLLWLWHQGTAGSWHEQGQLSSCHRDFHLIYSLNKYSMNIF